MSAPFTELTRVKMNAVVQIYAEGYAGEEVKSILNPRLGDLKNWSGSGFFVSSPYGEGILITNAHVVKNARSIEIMTMLTSEEKFQVETIGLVKSLEPDVAVLRLKDGELERMKAFIGENHFDIPHLELRDNPIVSRGTGLKAIGYPMGMTEPNITAGEITNFMSGERTVAEKYVTDAAINPGNSGGPAIDDQGQVIGINTSIYEEADNIGFITPSPFIAIILKNIFENNSVNFSDIGGTFQKNSDEVAKALKMEKAKGLIVSSVERGGFLDKAGIKKQDVLISLHFSDQDGNESLEQLDRHGILISKDHYHRRNLFDAFKLIPLDTLVSLKVWREGKVFESSAKSSPMPLRKIKSNPIIEERCFLDCWGLTIQVLSFEILESFNLSDTIWFYEILKKFSLDKERVIVTHVEKDSESYYQEWHAGEVIESVNGIKIKGLDHFLEILRERKDLYHLESESGSIGFFKGKALKKEVKLLNPSLFLK